MLFRRSILTLSRRTALTPMTRRTFTSSVVRRKEPDPERDIKRDPNAPPPKERVIIPGQTDDMIPFDDVRSMKDLVGPGAKPGTVPSDLEQATGIERLEILGKMQGVDIFDMKPLDASRLGTIYDPIMVKSFGDEQYCGCTGFPADSHVVKWLIISRDRPMQRCSECGSTYMMEYVGPPDDPHDHGHHQTYEEPKTMADFVRPEYRGFPEGFVEPGSLKTKH
ncbi:MAG: hypothetical protein LQ350_000089 [Teloschistes chrysophthalmus]|nr:MAG: hypothetical protein LQ350_000089 [Niorma chrysophthalma]